MKYKFFSADVHVTFIIQWEFNNLKLNNIAITPTYFFLLLSTKIAISQHNDIYISINCILNS